MGGLDVAAEVFSSLLLFGLVFGMSATVDVRQIFHQLHNWQALLIGVALQFVILPFVGFVVVKAFQLDSVVGVTLMVITSSPGGSYSNWWCSMFNAELALSVTMTALSTLLSTVMLPLNLVIYTKFSYSRDVVQSLDWTALFVSLVTVITGISCGMMASMLATRQGPHVAHIFHKRANLMGNIAGLSLIILSFAVSSSNQNSAVWDQNAAFYFGVAMPAVIGLSLALALSSKAQLPKPERVAVCVEGCYQNTGIATSVALTMFTNANDLAKAIGVPLYYGIVEAIMLGIFCIVAWKIGWTKAPPDEWICVILANTYETAEDDEEQEQGPADTAAIEVVSGAAIGNGDEKTTTTARCTNNGDIIFEQTADGAYVVDGESLADQRDKAAEEASRKNSDEPTENGDGLSVADGGNLRPDGLHKTTGANDLPADDDGQTGTRARLERTIAILRARAVGYRKAPAQRGSWRASFGLADAPEEPPPDDEEVPSADETITKDEVHAALDQFPVRGEQIPPSPLESADVEQSSSAHGSSEYQTISLNSPEIASTTRKKIIPEQPPPSSEPTANDRIPGEGRSID